MLTKCQRCMALPSGVPRTSSIQVETDTNESAFMMRRTEMRAFTLSSAPAT